MALWTDVIDPHELTVFTRQTLDQEEAAKGSLSTFFPNEVVPDTVVRYVKADRALTPVANYRAFDAESTIGTSVGGQRVTLELPPLSQKNRIGELDTIRNRAIGANADYLRKTIGTEAAKTVVAIQSRLELMRATVLESGKVAIDENGFTMDADLGRSAENNVVANGKWSDPEAAILDEILTWVEHYTEINGEAPGATLLSRKAMNYLKKNKEVIGSVSAVNPPSRANSAQVNAWFEDNDLPAPIIFDRKVRVGNTTRRLLSENKLFFLPEAGSNKLGRTTWGVTAEAGDPGYQIPLMDQAGLISAALRTDDPYGYWARSTAIALPVMTNPDASMVAEVY